MSFTFLTSADFDHLIKAGATSHGIVTRTNCPEAMMTINRIVMEPGSVQELHSHPKSEQVCIIEEGHATLHMDAGETRPIRAGDVYRTPPGALHGIRNTSNAPLVYLSITNPAIDLGTFYTNAPA